MMKKKITLLLGLALCAFGFSQNSQKGTISFFVRDAVTYYGNEAVITVKSKTGSDKLTTDKGGHVKFEVAPGKYDFTISAAGHNPLKTYFVVESGKTVNAEIILDRQDYKLPPVEKTSVPIVSGYIVDGATGLPMSNVSVRIAEENATTQTDEKGYFEMTAKNFSAMKQSTDKPVRQTLLFEKDGYGKYEETNVPMLPEKMCMHITLYPGNEKITKDYEHGLLDAHKKKENEKEIKSNPVESTGPGTPPSPQACLTIPGSIRVGTSCSCTSCSNVSVMTLETYVGSGLDDEWIASWHNNSLEAGSVAYRGYGAWYVLNPVAANYDIASTTCNQAYGSTTYSSVQTAAANMQSVVIEYNSAIARCEYSAENNNKGCGDGWSGTSTSWPCISDNVCTGSAPNGHGRGMCQWGSQRWANNQGQLSGWILDHYYNPGNMYVNYPSNCSPANLGVASGTCPVIGVNLSWANSGTGWYLDITDDPNFTYFWNKDVTGLTSVMCPGGFCDYPGCTSYLQFQPNTTYYWRIWDGANHTYGSSFTTPYCSTSDLNCSGSIFDSGGSGAGYSGNEDWVYVIEPAGASAVTMTFNSFDLEAASDYLDIYDGNSTAGTLLGSYSGTTNPGTVVANSGAMTLHFTSDPFVNNNGFDATWSCTMNTTGIVSSNDVKTAVVPNPFSENFVLTYSLPNNQHVNISLVDVLGQETLLIGEEQTSGNNKIKLETSDLKLAKGVYFVKCDFGGKTSVVKVMKQ